MKIKIDEEKCIGCGLCATLDPNIFSIDYKKGKAQVKNQPEEITKEIKSTIDNCPVSAINIEKND